MKLRTLLAGAVFAVLGGVGIAMPAQADVGFYIDSGDYWHNHRFDYCYYHNCGDRWYEEHHRHYWRDRDFWRYASWRHRHASWRHRHDWDDRYDRDRDRGHWDHHDFEHHDDD